MIVPVVTSEFRPSTVDLAVTLPVGRRPLLPSYAFFRSAGSKVTLDSLSFAVLVNV